MYFLVLSFLKVRNPLRKWIQPWLVVLVLSLLYVGLTLVRYDGDPMAFVLPGTRYSEPDPAGTPGYDGQFAYYIASDPFAGCPRCDVPAYRLQRIVYPLMAWALALGRVAWVPWTLIVINIVALAGGTYITQRLLGMHRVSEWYALLYGLYGGLVAGLRLDLTEPLAYGLIQAALWAWARRRHGLADVLWVLAALAKETALIAVAGLVLHLLLTRRWREAMHTVLAVGVPFLIWQGILWAWVGAPGIGSGGDMATGFEVIPFGGLWRVATISWPAFGLLLLIEGPLFVFPAIWALVLAGRDIWRGRNHPWVGVLLVQAAVLPFLPFSTWREPLAMARLAAGLVAAILLYGALRRSRRVLAVGFLELATLALLLNESVLPV